VCNFSQTEKICGGIVMEEKNDSALQFRGGVAGAGVPFLVLFVGIIILALSGRALPMAFWVPALGAILTALILAKKPTRCAEELINGMASSMVAIMMMAWFLAGIVAQILKDTSLINSLIWLSMKARVSPRIFTLLVFVLGCTLSTATGTALGTVIALSPILYPVGAAIGCNGAVLLGAIVSASYFGDNIAPVSDTTIASAYSQGTSVSVVVRSRLKYALVAAAVAAVLFFITGGSGTASGYDIASLGELRPHGLIMLLVPAGLIVLMFRGAHLIIALMFSAVFAMVLGLVSGLLDPARLLVIDLNSFTVGGVMVEGIMGLVDIAVFAFMLMGLINLLDKGGFFNWLINKLAALTKTPRSAEITIGIINIIINMLTVANTVAIVMLGPVAKRTLVYQHHISRDRSANILDAVSCGAMCLIPYAFGPMLAYMFAVGSGAVVDFSVFSVSLYAFHGWTLLIVMFIAMITGWGRTNISDSDYAAMKAQDEKTKAKNLMDM
jgi:Na+/H+ antiporter NhaC